MTAAIDIKSTAQAFQNHLESNTTTPWLKNIRAQSLSRFNEITWPTRKTEAWKYTSLLPLTEQNFFATAATATTIDTAKRSTIGARICINELDATRLVFINGAFNAELSDTASEATITLFSEANQTQQQLISDNLGTAYRAGKHVFAELSASLVDNGLLIQIPANKVVSKPIHIVSYNTATEAPQQISNRLLVIAETGSQATLIEHNDSCHEALNTLNNQVTEVFIRANAKLQHIRLQLEHESAIGINGLHVQQSRDSQYENHLVTFGGKIKRNDLQVAFLEPNAYASLDGVFLAKHKQHIDNQTALDHISPHCNSDEVYKGLITDSAKAVFNGRIHIHKDAQKTEAHLSNKNLLLSKQAEINTKPELEIYADDVKCSHGATVGQLDEKSLFYFQSRGIDQATAEGMLCFGFVNERITKIPSEPVQQFVTARIADFFSDIKNIEALWSL